MTMRFMTQLERDSDNSDPGDAELSDDGDRLTIKLEGPERTIAINVEDLLRVLDARRRD